MDTTNKKPIVLVTDFGIRDPFVGVMKAAIYSIYPDATIIDLTHNIQPQNLSQASFLLSTSFSYCPENTVFCAVVDPGVGTSRKPILIQTQHYIFIGPDNGVLWKSANKDTIKNIIHLNNEALFLPNVSRTFHGRDIFAPVSAHAARTEFNPDFFGTPVPDIIKLELPEPQKKEKGFELTVLHIDHFGNITLNLTPDKLQKISDSSGFIIKKKQMKVNKLSSTYQDGPIDEPFMIQASNGFYEISLKNENAADKFGIQINDKLMLAIDNHQT